MASPGNLIKRACVAIATLALGLAPTTAPAQLAKENPGLAGRGFRWISSAPMVAPVDRPHDACFSVKDPSIVRHGDRWHLFCTIRSEKRTHQIEYSSFADWSEADLAQRHVLKLREGYFCAPQVFFYTPHQKWYLLCQVSEPGRRLELQPAVSASDDVARPDSWSAAQLLFAEDPTNVSAWIDFWIICDCPAAHLFFTSLDGRMWHTQTDHANFPLGWSEPEIALQADIFEASHVYRLAGMDRYLCLVEAQAASGRRYYKAYQAQALVGPWEALADSFELPFAASGNVTFDGPPWTDSFSHGELLRYGYDERLEVDPARLEFLYQGVSDQERAGKVYGRIPWRLGLLRAAH